MSLQKCIISLKKVEETNLNEKPKDIGYIFKIIKL